MKKNEIDNYDYEEDAPKRKRYKNPDDMLKTMPGVDPNRHKRGIVGFVIGIGSFIAAFTMSVYVWFGSIALAAVGFVLAISQRRIKRTKISVAALVLNLSGLLIFAVLTVLYFSTDIFKGI